ncbi:hypothetical protein IPL85_02450 [Candidatus Saccharibacteria bacterium]|nr:MAG: hypothetical protein IPL85_02450 [Candidatus Saccharibacteria bacterium]
MIFARESLVLGAAVMVPVLWYVFRRERFGKFWSISLHASAHSDSTKAFGTGLLAASVLLAVYFQSWLIPKYDYGWPIRLALWAAVVCLVCLALVPHYEGRWQGRVHAFTSWVMVVLMSLTLLLQAVYSWYAAESLLALAGFIVQMTLLAVFYGVQGMYAKFALFQGMYISVYFLCIGVLGYI